MSILFPWWWAFQHHRSSMKSLKELGLAGRKRTIQLWEGLSCPIKSQQVHLKRYLSIIKPGRHQRTLGSWTLQKHLHWRLKRTFSFAGFVKKKEKRNILQFHLNFLSPSFHKNKRWFFKVPVSALFDILIWFWPNNRPNPSGWILKICYDFHPSLPVLSLSQWQIVCFPSFFIFPPMGKTLLL